MMIPKITPSVDNNWCLKRSAKELNEPTNQNSIKVAGLLIQRIRKRYYKALGTSVINSLFPLPP